MGIIINILKAGPGDSILIQIDNNNILVDGGNLMCYPTNLKVKLKELSAKDQSLDLIIATHFDEDHINGLYSLLNDVDSKYFPQLFIKEFWFHLPPRINIDFPNPTNTNIGVARAKKLETLLKNHNWNDKLITASQKPYSFKDNTKLWILSPSVESLKIFKDKYKNSWKNEITTIVGRKKDYETDLIDFYEEFEKEDYAESNGSSIAFLLEYKGENILLALADSHPSVVIKSLKELGYSINNKLNVNYTKLSHHGSKYSISKDFLEIINCENFIISTSGTKDNLPNKKTLSLIVKYYKLFGKKINFIFNYEESSYKGLFSVKDSHDFDFSKSFKNDDFGYKIEIK